MTVLVYTIRDSRGFIVDKKLQFSSFKDAHDYAARLKSQGALVGSPTYEVR